MKEYLYTSKADGRQRLVIVTDDGKHTSKSYPRVLMERYLGRELLPEEDVHHIDGNKQNNNLSNLTVILHGEHQKQHSKKKYFPKVVECEVCHKQFVWTDTRQGRYYRDLRVGRIRNITCSRSCSSYIGRMTQLGRDYKSQ